MEWKRNSSSPADQQFTEMGSIVSQFQTMHLDSKISRLPEDILVDILSRLPVKSLLKLRCVSKSWLSLISSPNFIKTHLQNSIKNNSITHYRIMLATYDQSHHVLNDYSLHSLLFKPVSDTNRTININIDYPMETPWNLDLDHSDTNRTININIDYPMETPWNLDHLVFLFHRVSDAIKIDYPMKIPWNSVRVVGSCNGLVCIVVDGKQVFLWNPTTRKAKQLRDSGMEMNSDRLFHHGFGFDEANDDYKVVEICCDSANKSLLQAIVMVYSLKADSWKRIGDFEGYFRKRSGTFLNGKLHWLSKSDIVSLDIETDLYGTIEQPPGFSEPTLCVLRACLCVLRSNWTDGDLWILKEYGVKESWTKMAFIPYMEDPTNYMEIRPHYMLNNGEVLLSFGSFFVVFNPKDQSLRRPIIPNVNYDLDAKIYVESLVSPFGDDGLGGPHQ